MTERVSKRIDFAKERRAQGRSLNNAVRKLVPLIQPLAQQHGIDLQTRLNETSARKSEERRLLAERLQESVVPLFIGGSDGQPDRIGSCVLVRLDSDLFAFSAAHVIREAASARLFAPSEGRGGKLLPLPPCAAHLISSEVITTLMWVCSSCRHVNWALFSSAFSWLARRSIKTIDRTTKGSPRSISSSAIPHQGHK